MPEKPQNAGVVGTGSRTGLTASHQAGTVAVAIALTLWTVLAVTITGLTVVPLALDLLAGALP